MEIRDREDLRQRLHQAVRTAVALGRGSRYDFSEVSSLGRVDRRAQVITLAKQGLINEWLSWSEAEQTLWEFTTCQRSDGSLYGSRGKCRQGKEVSKDQAALQRAANRKRKSGRYGGSLKKRLGSDPEVQHLERQHKGLEKKRRAAQSSLKKAAEALESDRWNAARRDEYRAAQQAANAAYTAAERVRTALERRVREIERLHQSQNRRAAGRPSRDVPEWANETGKQLR